MQPNTSHEQQCYVVKGKQKADDGQDYFQTALQRMREISASLRTLADSMDQDPLQRSSRIG